MDLIRKFNCKVQLFNPTGQTSSSESVYPTDPTTISGFIWGSEKRILTKSEEEITLNFKMLILPSTTAVMDGLLKVAVDPIGNLLFEEGKIVSVEPIVHPIKGLKAVELGIVRW